MATPYGTQAGGHTMSMTYDLHGATDDNIAGCETCHALVEDFGFNDVQATVQAQLDELATLLRAKGIMAAAPSTSSKTGSFPANLAAAFINWQTVTEDKSLGIHNPTYVIGVLNNTIETVKGM